MANDFIVLGGLRYDKDELTAMLGRTGIMREEIVRESSVFKWAQSEGRQEGIILSLRTDSAEQVRRLIASAAAQR